MLLTLAAGLGQWLIASKDSTGRSAAAAAGDDFVELSLEPLGDFRVGSEQVVLFARVGVEVEKPESGDFRVGQFGAHVDIPGRLAVVTVEFPRAGTKPKRAARPVILLDELVASFGIGLAEQRGGEVEAIETGVVG